MGNGIFRYVDPLAGVQTSFDGVPLLDELMNKFGWTSENIGPVYQRYILDEPNGPPHPKPVIRPNQIIHDGISETVSLKRLLKPRMLLPYRGIMFTSDTFDWDKNEHIPQAIEEWAQIFEKSVEVYPCKGITMPRDERRHVVPDRWYGIVRIEFPNLYLVDQLDVPAREYSIPLGVLANPDNIKVATGRFESCFDRARRLNNWIFHKPYVW